MQNPFYLQLIFLILGIGLIILLTGKFNLHPFFALVIVSLLIGLGSGFSPLEVIGFMKDGFGNIMKSLAFLIIFGTTLGILLEKNGSTMVLANYILQKVGTKKSALAMNITGFVVGMPIFCDSGFIVLSGLNLSLARKSGISVAILAISLATGLYSVHCLIPPHPGASAAAGIIGVDFGKLILFGIMAAIPASLVGYWWALRAGKRLPPLTYDMEDSSILPIHKPSILQSILPIFVPIVLIALKSFIGSETSDGNIFDTVLNFIGEPVVALCIGTLLCFTNLKIMKQLPISGLLQQSIEKSGSILVIIGAGGAFGAVLSATRIGEQFSEVIPLENFGILFPFLLTSLLKTAQGSSTVAIITAASIIHPLLPSLGLDDPSGRLLCLLAMGAGSMMLSHANDAYFWVIANFQKIPTEYMLKIYSLASVFMGLVTLMMVYLFSFIL